MTAIQVSVIGCINDQKFTTRLSGQPGPDKGQASLRLEYSNVPALWHPFAYSDPLVLLADYREDGAFNFRSLARHGFTAACTIDFGRGLLLRKTADIHWAAGLLLGGYAIWGSASCPDIVAALPYEEFMHPVGADMIGIGMARWRTGSGEIIGAVTSARYKFDQPTGLAKIPQVRRITPTLRLSPDGLVVDGEFETVVSAFHEARPAGMSDLERRALAMVQLA